jgi:hypothetical protein
MEGFYPMTEFEKVSEQITEVDRKLDGVCSQVSHLEATLNERCPFHTDQINYHHLTLYGKPENGTNPGLVGRVSDLERSCRLVLWGIRSLWGMCVTIIVAALIAYLGL